MARHILKCSRCSEYTMKEVHDCGEKAISTKPPKYSPEDKYGKYRRQTKSAGLRQRGML